MENHEQYTDWYLNLDGPKFLMSQENCMLYLQLMLEVNKVTALFDTAWAKKQMDEVKKRYNLYVRKGGRPSE